MSENFKLTMKIKKLPVTRPLFIKVRVTPEEKSLYMGLAKRAGVTLSEFIRFRLSGVRIRPLHLEQERNRLLAQFGNNLNQIARWVNQYKSSLEALKVVAALESLHRSIHDFSNQNSVEEANDD